MEKRWLKHYEPGVPAEINPDTYASLPELFEDSCVAFYDKPAFVNMGHALSFQALEQKSRDFAAYLQSHLQLKKGDRIALMMPNILQYPVAMWGALRAGLIVVNVNPLYTARELEELLLDSGSLAIVVLANFAHTVQEVMPYVALKHIIITEVGDLFPWPHAWLVNNLVKYLKKMVPSFKIPGYIPFKTVLTDGAKLNFMKPPLTGTDIAYLQYTGGTTSSLIKGAMLSHRNIVANIEQASAWIKPSVRIGQEIIITALPLYHIFSLTANCLTFMKLGALNVLITNPRDMKTFISTLKKYPFTAMTGVNTLFNALLNQPDFATVSFDALHITLGGGMAVQKAVADHWKQVTNTPLLEAYGLTETSPAVCINPFNLSEYNGSIGLPVPSTDVSIRNEEGEEVPLGALGELWVKGPQVMQGYWDKPELTAESLQDGWVRTGDMVTDGYMKLLERKKDIIIVSGFNVYPNEVEDVIALMPEVSEVAVVGEPNAERGELVKAFIVKKDLTLTTEDVIQFCQKQLAQYKIPKLVEFRDTLPKTPVGKILRRALREADEPPNYL
jgi:long-chain acyl-CoA synthetase